MPITQYFKSDKKKRTAWDSNTRREIQSEARYPYTTPVTGKSSL